MSGTFLVLALNVPHLRKPLHARHTRVAGHLIRKAARSKRSLVVFRICAHSAHTLAHILPRARNDRKHIYIYILALKAELHSEINSILLSNVDNLIASFYR